MDNPLVTVDASQIETLVADMFKNMTRCIKIFDDHPRERLCDENRRRISSNERD